MTRSRPPLSRERIIEVALHIVDAEGLDGLSMRRLGGELGVDPMMVYRHVADKDALVDLVLERVRSKMVVPQPPPDDLAELFETVFVEYRRVLTAHPNVIPLATRRTDVSQPSGLDHLVSSGVPLDDAVQLYQSLTAFTVGFCALGAPAATGDWDRFPDPLAERLHDWSDTTFRRTLRLILAGYGLRPPGGD
jgi:AcrR family transcriptional regulator